MIGTLGRGRSVAINLSMNTTRAAIRGGARVTGNLSITAHGNQNGLVAARCAPWPPPTPVRRPSPGSLANNSSVALIDTGTTLNLGGILTVQADHDATTILRVLMRLLPMAPANEARHANCRQPRQ